MQYVLDTNIWIYLFKNYEEIQLLKQHIAQGLVKPVLTPVTYAEVLGYPNHTLLEKQAINHYFSKAKMLTIEMKHWEQIIQWRRQGIKTKMPDLLIAACSKIADIPLLTRNEKDFISLDIRFENPWKTI
jgi:predicted nucleic acid-binding protein